jgi:hypothetical protein
VIKAEDMYTADLSAVDVVAVYLYPTALEKLKPQFDKLKPGARIASHQFEIPGVKPFETYRSRVCGNRSDASNPAVSSPSGG